MDYKNKLVDFWGYIPTFHDDNITDLYLENKTLTITIKSKTNKVLHPKEIYTKYAYVATTIKYADALITNIEIVANNMIINKLSYEKNICIIDGVLGSLQFTFSKIIDISIETKPLSN